MSLLYLIFSAPDSEQYDLLVDLVDAGFGAGTRIGCLLPAGEVPEDLAARIEKAGGIAAEYETADGRITAPETGGPDVLLIVAPARSHPADMIEALDDLRAAGGHELGRILTVVHCSFLKAAPKAQAWYDACIHFSDAVLLARREAVDNRWTRDFENRYHRECLPCLFLLVKKGRLKNPREATDPQARRLSLYFDELEQIEEDNLDPDDADFPGDTGEDPYIERLSGGQRAKTVPDIGALWDGFAEPGS